MENEKNINDFSEIINLFRKIITSLACIEKIATDDYTRNTAKEYLLDTIKQYEKYNNSKDVMQIKFKYSQNEIVDFCNECYEKVDIFDFAEDVEFGFCELIEKI